MSAELIKVENRNVGASTEIFGESLIERFAKFAGVSESSRVTYAKSLRQMFRYFKANLITDPTREDLINWVEDMKAIGRSNSTITLYTAAAKIFFRWTAQERIYPNIADHLKTGLKPTHNHKKDALSIEQCKDLVANVKGNSVKDLRDAAILTIMTTAGLRTVEIVRANVGDIRFECGKVFLYVWGKGHADADEKVLLSKQAHKAIRVYLKARGKVNATDPLFVSTSRSNRGSRLETQTISRMVKKNLRGIGLDSPRLTAHSLRHAVCSNLLFAGVELPKIQMIARHRSLSTTMIYQHAFERYNNDGEQILANLIFGKFKE